MKSFVTSFNGLFSHRSTEVPFVERVEIPLIQRDYAQGRKGATVQRIRESFLDVLHRAVTLGQHVSLDFVFGDVEAGTLRPLDGQQRLTTLFLLHWYRASRAGRLDEAQGWKSFTYATRPSARLFCQRLVQCQPPPTVNQISEWLKDQPWYLHTWSHDPTIESMLVMLDAMQQRFLDDDCPAAWDRLIDPQQPVISFHLLPIEQMGLGEDLYIKMNSRGKPLTPFENFKARFEQTLAVSCPERLDEFATKVDTAWADMLWPYHGGDFIVDQEFLRYFHFVTEICEWKDERLDEDRFDIPRTERVFGPDNPRAAAHLDFLFQAFDTWVNGDIGCAFESIFVQEKASLDTGDTARVVLFGLAPDSDVNLFSACCRDYGEMRGRNRLFSLQHTILFYAVLLHRLNKAPDFPRRLRVLRNLIEASGNEVRLDRMPALLADVERLILLGSLDGVAVFNQGQVADERTKAVLLSEHPELQSALFLLEDHPILRGCLPAFELDAATLDSRSAAFRWLFSTPSCWLSLAGALLASGDYSRKLNSRQFQFGSFVNPAPWHELLAEAGRSSMETTRSVLGRLLDTVTPGQGDPIGRLEDLQRRWLEATKEGKALGWRYYFVRYSCMRQGRSGRYVGLNGSMGYSVCMLNRHQMNSHYRDPFLLAIHRESGVRDSVQDPWFTGYESLERWLQLKKSRAGIRCIEAGLVVRPPLDTAHVEAFQRVCREHGVGDEGMLLVPAVDTDEGRMDTRDRVQMGAALLRDLVNAGL